MSTYRERRAARAERLREWAARNEAKSAAGFRSAKTIADGIPFGQPILVGHHSEKHHRRDIARIDAGMRKGIEHEQTAREQNSRANEIERQAERAIYRDDHDAIDRLREKLADLEAKRERMKAENAAYRKGDQAFAELMGITVEGAAAIRVKIDADLPWCRQPHPSYSLQNLGGTINRERKRLAELEAAKTPHGAATVATDATTATARAGLIITATQTTPAKTWKKPRPVWNVSGNLAFWRPSLCDLGGNWYRGVVSFWDDPTADIERMCAEAEADATAAPAPAEAPAES